MTNTKFFSIVAFLSLLVITSCNKDEIATEDPIENVLNLPETPYDYTTIDLPDHLTTNVLLGSGQNAAIENDNTPTTNPTTNEGATLGRVLFYDKKLSANGQYHVLHATNRKMDFQITKYLA